MKNTLSLIASLVVLGLTHSAFAADQCATVSCDCDNLPSESWVQTCKNQESRIIADCVKNKVKDLNELGYCSLHGPGANRLPLALNLKAAEAQPVEDIPKLNNSIAALYWSIIKDFDSFESSVERAQYKNARLKLRTLNSNVDQLFQFQKTVGTSLSEDGKENLAQLAWRDFSADTLSFGSDFYIRAESILNSYDEISDENQREEFREIGLKLMDLSGKVFEQVGVSYANGMRHKHAGKAWKNASKASSIIMAHSANRSQNEYYRFQAASRLHRASYHWVVGTGRGGAEESLAESQKFMDDGSSISGLVEEERRLKQERPFWSK
ncbi:MAG: hypothetical protein K6L76_04875 [Agarilytica sp.]